LPDLLGIASKTDKVHLRRILTEIYNLREDEFVIKDVGDEYKVEIRTDRDIPGIFRVKVSEDDMKVFLSLYPPVNNGKKINLDNIYEELEEQGIKFGILDNKTNEAISITENGNILENILIAKGLEPIDGKDAAIIKHFEKKITKKEVDEKARVDYKEVFNIINVEAGELLVTKKPATSGVPGRTVKNIEIKPKSGKDIEISIIEGVREENNNFYAEIDGYVEFKNNKIAVYPLYKVRCVDYKTGNINFKGAVHVIQDVLFGFKVVAQKDVVVEGVCDDCVIIAEENIVIKGGIKGKKENLFKAGKSFICGYMENANVYCDGDVTINKYSYNSNIYSRGKIVATQGRGVIAGGEVVAFSEVECNILGSPGVSNFLVKVGTDYLIEKELVEKEQEYGKINMAILKANEVLSQVNLKSKAAITNPKVVKLLEYQKELLQRRDALFQEIDGLKRRLRYYKPRIRVKGTVYGGVTIQMYGKKLKVKEKMESIVFFLEPKYEDIGYVSLKEVGDLE